MGNIYYYGINKMLEVFLFINCTVILGGKCRDVCSEIKLPENKTGCSLEQGEVSWEFICITVNYIRYYPNMKTVA